MRRGRLFIYLGLILLVIIAAVVIFFRPSLFGGGGEVQATPTARLFNVVLAGQSIPRGIQITEDMLTTMQMHENFLIQGMVTDISQVVGKYAKYPLDPGFPIIEAVLTDSPGIFAEGGGSPWAYLIPIGKTAISIPSSRLASLANGIWDGDHVNVIASLLLVDVDTDFQSILPNSTAGVMAAGGRAFLIGGGTRQESAGEVASGELLQNIVAQSVSGLYLAPQGRPEYDANLNSPFYIVPTEAQRPRLVSHMIMQDIPVLHVGTFPQPGEKLTGLLAEAIKPTPAQGVPTAVPTAIGAGGEVVEVEQPDVITLIVDPKDAVTLIYLLYSGSQFNLSLRNPSDESRIEVEAITLQYLLTAYDIPVPARVPYAIEPRVDELTQPVLPNDKVITPTEE